MTAIEAGKGGGGPKLFPLMVVIGGLLWIIATTGGYQVFVAELLGKAYDSQAEHFLRGDVGVDVDTIQHEAMFVNGRWRMYFGPFPAFLRIPLNFVYPDGRGHWSRISGFSAGMIALAAFAGLIRMALRASELSRGWQNCLGNAALVGFAFGSPLLLLVANVSLYDEAIIWGFALSLAALFFTLRAQQTEGAALTFALAGFATCAGGALLSRVTFGAPFILIAPILALSVWPKKRITNLTLLLLPLLAALAFYLWLSYARFGNLLGVNYDYYINPRDKAFIHNFGVFNLRRIPYSLADYFSLRLPSFYREPPFLVVGRYWYDYRSGYTSLFMNPFSEVYVSLLWCSPWLIFGAIIGIVCLFRPKGAGLFERAVAIALFAQCVCILSFYGLTQRYATELYPFLIFCFFMFLKSRGVFFAATRYAIIGLVAISTAVNVLSTASWLTTVDSSVPKETRLFWSMKPNTR
jgi:hypothetical protein